MKKNGQLVTIAIPTYNRADGYLGNAIDCALRQTYDNIEILVSDNCSNDHTEQLVRGFHDPRIRYFRHEQNIGANNNFNFCVEQARGDYFLLFHDDDMIDDDFIAVCMKAVGKKKDIGIIRTGTRIIDSDSLVQGEWLNLVQGSSMDEFIKGWFEGRTVMYLCSTLFNTRGLREIGGFSSKRNLFQDVIAEVQLAAKMGRIDLPDVKASFRKHDAEYTFAVKVGHWCEDSLMLLDIICGLVSADARSLIREEGMKFFATINYSRASHVRSVAKRFMAYVTVFRMFRYRHLPSMGHILYQAKKPFFDTSLYALLRNVKRKMKVLTQSMS